MARKASRGDALGDHGGAEKSVEEVVGEAKENAAHARARKRAESIRKAAKEAAGITPEHEESEESVPQEVRLDDDTVSEAARARTRSRKAGAGPEVEPSKSVAMDRVGVGILLNMVEGIMAGRFGDSAKFTKAERDLIEPSLSKMLSSLSPSTAKSITIIANPLMLGAGIFLYVMRLSSLAKTNRPDDSTDAATVAPAGPTTYDRRVQPTPPPQNRPTARTNGDAQAAMQTGIVPDELARVWQ